MWRVNLKKKIFKSTMNLIILSTLAKALSFGVRIFLARKLSLNAMNIYSLAMPSLLFLIALANMGIPSALSKVIAQSKSAMTPILSAIVLSFVNNILLIVSFMMLIPSLNDLIFMHHHESVLKAMLYMIPMVTLSGLLKGILQGKQHHEVATASQILEEVFRIVYLIVALHPALNAENMAYVAMLSIFVGECGSTLFMLAYLLFKKYPLPIKKSLVDMQSIKEILNLSLPMTSSRFIGSFTFFIEPLLLVSVNALLSDSYSVLNGYVLPILTMPSFISMTLSSALLPSFTYEMFHNHKTRAMKIFRVMMLVCFFVSLVCNIVTYFYPEQILNLFYHNSLGATMLKGGSIFFVFYSLQPILSSVLHAINRSKHALLDTLLGSLVRLAVVFFLANTLQESTLLVALVAGMLVTTGLHAWNVFWYLPRFVNNV